jgi:ligand-binding sensor domain-containing protein/two-component sensor histidine kinase
VSRFDGYRFVNYRIGDAASAGGVFCIHELDGVYWIDNIRGGLYRYDPRSDPALSGQSATSAVSGGGRELLRTQKISDEVLTVCEGCHRDFWVASARGLFRLADEGGRTVLVPVDLHLPAEIRDGLAVALIDEGLDGSLWLGTNRGPLRRLPTGQVVQYQIRRAGSRDVDPPTFRNLVQARDGRIWIGYRTSLYRFRPEPASTFAGSPSFSARVIQAGLPSTPGEQSAGEAWDLSAAVQDVAARGRDDSPAEIGALYQQQDGTIWATCRDRLLRFDGQAFHVYSDLPVRNKRLQGSILSDDPGGGLWVAGRNALARLSLQGMIYDAADGLSETGVDSIHEADGVLQAINHDDRSYSRFAGRVFERALFDVPAPVRYALLDHTGQWWVSAKGDLYRFAVDRGPPEAGHVHPSAEYSAAQGLPGNPRLMFEDSRGDLWVSADAPPALARWQRSTSSFRGFAPADGLPAGPVVHAFGEDHAGTVWLGLSDGSLVRYAAGRFTVPAADGLPNQRITAIHFDRAGRLWLTSYGGGVRRADDPRTEPLHFIPYTTVEGLSSNNATCLTEDLHGRIYVGTANGVDSLAPGSNRITNYGPSEGWGTEFITSAHRDSTGALWFGKTNGLIRLNAPPEPEARAPAAVIVGLRITGDQGAVRDFGDVGRVEIRVPDLAPDENGVDIDFSSIGHGELVWYQYRLQDKDGGWKLTTQREVRYERLAPGRYHFRVQALGSAGVAGTPAGVDFTILSPLWQRWWFVTLAALAGGLVIAASYRNHAARTIEVERVRTRIATDLHDDVGSSLSQIAILSEVVRRELAPGSAVGGTLAAIAATSRELVDSMSEIVWAINPNRDRAGDLAQRMRRFASDTFTGGDINFTFAAQEATRHLKLGPDVRRQVFLFFKEVVNNIARHSECTQAAVQLGIENGRLNLVLEDNGRGFDTAHRAEGQGLSSMRRRASELQGELEIRSEHGGGTRVALRVPLVRSRWLRSDGNRSGKPGSAT